MKTNKRILFLVPYPAGEAPSQRFRFEQYFKILEQEGVTFNAESFWSQAAYRKLYTSGNIFFRVAALLGGWFRRKWTLLSLHKYDFVFLHREAAPVGPPVLEWIIAKVFGKKIIYDFDDAIWLPDELHASWLKRFIRQYGKTARICRYSYKVSCGNSYLATYAATHNRNVVVNPTTIDTGAITRFKQRKDKDEPFVVGWTGSHSTLKYLEALEPVLDIFLARHPVKVKLLVIANRRPSFQSLPYEFVPWSKETETEDLLKMDVGLMPLPDDEWTRGKCGFKALQYMALGIPTLASPVGVNSEIVAHGQNGFLCRTDEEWMAYLETLLKDVAERERMGANGRQTVALHYSTASNRSTFLNLFV